MDPVGPQKKIEGSEHKVSLEKLLTNGGAKNRYSGDFNTKSGTHPPDFKTAPRSTAHQIGDWQGKTKGGTKHTYKGE